MSFCPLSKDDVDLVENKKEEFEDSDRNKKTREVESCVREFVHACASNTGTFPRPIVFCGILCMVLNKETCWCPALLLIFFKKTV